MRRRTKILLACSAVTMASAATVAACSGGDEPLTGETYDRAVAAAVEHMGGGTVVDTAVGDDGAAYEVELEMDDGTQYEVNLDENFVVISAELDD